MLTRNVPSESVNCVKLPDFASSHKYDTGARASGESIWHLVQLMKFIKHNPKIVETGNSFTYV